jgi:hypothetical protein
MSDDLIKQARVAELEAQVAALSAEPTEKEATDLWYGISTADERSFRAGIKSALTAFLRRRSQP